MKLFLDLKNVKVVQNFVRGKGFSSEVMTSNNIAISVSKILFSGWNK